MIDPLLLVELLETHTDWEVRYLEDDKGIFIGPDFVLDEMLEGTDLELEGAL